MKLQHIPSDFPLLVAALEAARLPTEDLGAEGTFFALSDNGRTVAFGGLELHGEDVLLRSVVVLPEARGKGFGRAVTEAVLARAYDENARRAWLLTDTAHGFFTHAGFRRVDRAQAPAAILATRQAMTICTTAALLTRPLSPP